MFKMFYGRLYDEPPMACYPKIFAERITAISIISFRQLKSFPLVLPIGLVRTS